jgi:hypothetical protein
MSDLWMVQVWLGAEGQRQLTLWFRGDARASEALGMLTPDRSGEDAQRVEVMDDFGSLLSCDPRDVLAVMAQDAGKALEAQVEYSLLQARGQAKAQRRAASDPMLGKAVMPAGFGVPGARGLV